MLSRLLPPLLCALALGAPVGCTLQDQVDIPQRPETPTPEPTPEPEQPAGPPSGPSSSSARLTTVLVLADAAPTEREEYDLTQEDGTRITGWYDPTTGEFDLIYDYPTHGPDELDRLHQAGGVHLQPHDARPDADPAVEIVHSGEYLETQTFNDGRSFGVDYGYAARAEATEFWGRSQEGDTLQGTLRAVVGGQESTETWVLEGVYQLDTVETLYDDGHYQIEYTHDDLTTEVSPDQVGHYDMQADGSGTGTVQAWDDDGTLYDYRYVFAAGGGTSGTFTIDDPATSPNPDIVGRWTDDLATGDTVTDYTLFYPDGTALLVTDVGHTDGSTDQTYTWDDPETKVDPDVRGQFRYEADGSGEGSVTVYSLDGSTTVCDYELGPEGRVLEEDCRPGPRATPDEVPTKQSWPA